MISTIKGVILAGGTGSRLEPLTRIINKHLLPVGRQPMILHPLQRMVQAGVTDILIISGREHLGDFIQLLGDGSEFGAALTYRVQQQPGGIAEALGLARSFVGSDPLMVCLGDNIFENPLAETLHRFRQQQKGARVVLKEVPDPWRFGVACLQNGKITSIEEKPQEPKSNLAVTGVYLYDPSVFDIIDGVGPSQRGEREITDVNNAYAAKNLLEYDITTGWWTDAGTFASLARANRLLHPGDSP